MSRLTALLLVACLVVAGCSIQPDAAPSDLPDERADVFGEPDTGDAAAGTNRIYLLAPSDADSPVRLRSVQRGVPTEPAAVIASLFSGPNSEERQSQLDTAIPSDVNLLGVRQTGALVTVDVNDVFDELTPDGLRLAVAQIVATATDLEGVGQVQLRVDGEPRVWPLGNGELTDRPLTVFDYPGIVESSQPPFPAIPSAGP
jgi:spore germination protein GerM